MFLLYHLLPVDPICCHNSLSQQILVLLLYLPHSNMWGYIKIFKYVTFEFIISCRAEGPGWEILKRAPPVRPSVHPSVGPSVTFSFRANSKAHCCIFSKLCRYVRLSVRLSIHPSVRPSRLVFALTRKRIAVFSRNFAGTCSLSWGCAV